jgi:hypothetical protein
VNLVSEQLLQKQSTTQPSVEELRQLMQQQRELNQNQTTATKSAQE